MIKEGTSVVTAHINQEAVLQCEYTGDTSATVMWRKDGFPIAKDNTKYVFFYTQNTHSLHYTHCFITVLFCTCSRYNMPPDGSLRVRAVQLSDAGRYLCTVSNQAGSDHRGVDLRVFGEDASPRVYVAEVS